jgi:hypothetical protein
MRLGIKTCCRRTVQLILVDRETAGKSVWRLRRQIVFVVVAILLLCDATFLNDVASDADVDVDKIYNVSKAFYVDDVAYDIFDAENVVCLFYENVDNRRFKSRRQNVSSTSTQEILIHLNKSQKVKLMGKHVFKLSGQGFEPETFRLV